MDDFVPSPTQPGEDFRASGTLAAPKKESAYERAIPQPIKDAIGGVESAGRMIWNVPAGMVAGGLAGIGGAIEGAVTGQGAGNQAQKRMEQAQEKVHIPAATKSGDVADEMFGAAYDYIKRDVVAEALLAIDKHEWNALKIPPEKQAQLESHFRTTYEAGFDAYAFGGLIKKGIDYNTALRTERKRLQEQEAAKEQQQAQAQRDAQTRKAYAEGRLNQGELDFSPEGSLIPPGVRSPYNLTKEQIATAERELNPPAERRVEGQSELFTEYQPAEANLLGEAYRGARERLDTPETARADADPALGFRQGELDTRQGHPYEPMGRQAEQRPLEFPGQPEITEFGKVGEARRAASEARDAARAKEAPIEFEAVDPAIQKWRSVPKSQRGGVDFQSVIDALMTRYGGHDRSKWTEQTRKNAADDAKYSAMKATGVQKEKYEAAYKELSKPLVSGPGKSQIGAIGDLKWANKEANWRSLEAGDYKVDIIKQGGEHVIELRKKGSTQREYSKVAQFDSFTAAKMFAQDYAKYLDNQGERPSPFSDKYKYVTPSEKKLLEQMKANPEHFGYDKDNLPSYLKGPGKSQRGVFDISAYDPINFIKWAKQFFEGKNSIEGYFVRPGDGSWQGRSPAQKAHWLLEDFKRSIREKEIRNRANRDNVFDEYGRIVNDRRYDEITTEVKEFYSSDKNQQQLTARAIDELHEEIARITSAVEFDGPFGIGHADPFHKIPKGPGRRQAGMLNLGLGEKKKPVAEGLMDFKRQFNVEKRKLGDLVTQEGIKPETIKDIASTATSRLGNLDRLWKEGVGNFAIDKTMSILAATRGDVGKIIKWAVDHRRSVTREKDNRIREREEAVLRPLQEIMKSPNEAMEMKNTWLENIGKGELTRESFKTERQWQTFKAIQDVLKAGWEETNKWRKIAKFQPIEFLNNYFPSIREGEYWVRVTDQLGELKWAGAAKTLGEGKAMEKAMRKEYEGKGMIVEPVYQRKKGPYELADLSAFEETLKVLEKNDPITQAIQARYAELAGKRGFARTGIFRKGIPGALGFEKGETGLRNMEKVLENYIKRQEAYIANLKIGQLRQEYAKLPKEMREKIPTADKWINEYFNHSVGMSMDKLSMIKGAMEGLGTAAGLGRDALPNFLHDLSGVASMLWLTNMRFTLSQTLQPLLAIPKIMQMRNIDPSVQNSMKSYWEGQRKWWTRTEDSKDAVQWASKNGYLDSAITSLIGLKATDLRGQRWGIVGNAVRYPLAKIEKEVVRGPVYLMFEHALKDSVKEPQKRFEMAAEMMDYYMTHYDRESSPLMYNKMGALGDQARPLKQYQHNNFGQFFEYAQTLKNRGEAGPLASYMGMQALVGGLKGVILVAEATWIINQINDLFDKQIPTPEEAMLRANLPDWLIFGGASVAMGADISSSVAAPSMPNMFSMAGIEFGKEAIEASYNYMSKRIMGKDTDADALRAAMALSPKAMHGWLEQVYTTPGGPVPKPKQGMKGTYRRDDTRGFDKPGSTEHDFTVPWDFFSDKEKGVIFSLKSTHEARADMTARITKQLLAKDIEQKISAVDTITDRLMNNKPISPELIRKYVEEGGDPKNLVQGIKDRLVGRVLTNEENMYRGKQVSPSRAHKIERMRDLIDERQDTLLRDSPKDRYEDKASSLGLEPTAMSKAQAAERPDESLKNLSIMAALPGVKIKRFSEESNVNGYVNRGDNNTIYLNERYRDWDQLARTARHEAEHLLAARGLGDGGKINRQFDEMIRNAPHHMLEMAGGGAPLPGNGKGIRGEIVQDFVDAAPYLEKKYGAQLNGYFDQKMIDFQKKYGLHQNLFFEQLATLSALEQEKGIKLTDDPYIREHVLTNRYVRAIFDSLKGFRQTRLDSKDRPGYEAFIENSDKSFIEKALKKDIRWRQ